MGSHMALNSLVNQHGSSALRIWRKSSHWGAFWLLFAAASAGAGLPRWDTKEHRLTISGKSQDTWWQQQIHMRKGDIRIMGKVKEELSEWPCPSHVPSKYYAHETPSRIARIAEKAPELQ